MERFFIYIRIVYSYLIYNIQWFNTYFDKELKTFFVTLTNILLIVVLILMIVFAIISLIVMFLRQDIRKNVSGWFKKIFIHSKTELEDKDFFDNLTSALMKLSSEKVGAIIAIEREDSLEPYINVGYKVLTDFSPEFVISVFYNKHSALHDGGIIIRGRNIVSVSSYFPMTRQLLDVSYGARHRSAVGLSDRTDSIVFVVSETTGRISVAHRGAIKKLSQNPDRLIDEITKLLIKNNSNIEE